MTDIMADHLLELMQRDLEVTPSPREPWEIKVYGMRVKRGKRYRDADGMLHDNRVASHASFPRGTLWRLIERGDVRWDGEGYALVR